MADPKRATIYFAADVQRALRLKALAADRSLVNAAVKAALSEDAPRLQSAGPSATLRSSPWCEA
jgi:hypothetical protein